MVKKIILNTSKRWRIIFKDKNNYIFGLYKPEHTTLDQIRLLEKHNHPEAFLLIKGQITLVTMDGKSNKIKEIPLKKGELVVIDTWHNAYRKTKESLALVVEKPAPKTIFKVVLK